MDLERNFCETVRFRLQVEDLQNVNAADDTAGEYFEPIVS